MYNKYIFLKDLKYNSISTKFYFNNNIEINIIN